MQDSQSHWKGRVVGSPSTSSMSSIVGFGYIDILWRGLGSRLLGGSPCQDGRARCARRLLIDSLPLALALVEDGVESRKQFLALLGGVLVAGAEQDPCIHYPDNGWFEAGGGYGGGKKASSTRHGLPPMKEIVSSVRSLDQGLTPAPATITRTKPAASTSDEARKRYDVRWMTTAPVIFERGP